MLATKGQLKSMLNCGDPYHGDVETVSIILPVFNGSRYIHEAVTSILSQDYKHFELLIIDDGSTDQTCEILGDFKDDRIIYFYQKNGGVSSAINTGLRMAKGRFIAHCDADDLWLKNKLSNQLQVMVENPKAVLSGTWATIINAEGKKIGKHIHTCSSSKIKIELMFRNPFVHSSLMYSRTAAFSAGLYSSSQHLSPPEDYDFIARMAAIGEVLNIDKRLVLYRHHPEGLSKRKDKVLEENATNISASYISRFIALPLDLKTIAVATFYRGRGSLASVGQLKWILKQSLIIWKSPQLEAGHMKMHYLMLLTLSGLKMLRNRVWK